MFKEHGWGHGSVTLNVWSVNRALGTAQHSSRTGIQNDMFGEVWSLWLTAFAQQPHPTPTQLRQGWGQYQTVLLNRWIQKFVFVISYCSLIEASKIMRNKSGVSRPELAAVG